MLYESHEDFEQWLEEQGITEPRDNTEVYLAGSRCFIPMPGSEIRSTQSVLKSFWWKFIRLFSWEPMTDTEWMWVMQLKVQGLISIEQLRRIHYINRKRELRRQFWINVSHQPAQTLWLWIQDKIQNWKRGV